MGSSKSGFVKTPLAKPIIAIKRIVAKKVISESQHDLDNRQASRHIQMKKAIYNIKPTIPVSIKRFKKKLCVGASLA